MYRALLLCTYLLFLVWNGARAHGMHDREEMKSLLDIEDKVRGGAHVTVQEASKLAEAKHSLAQKVANGLASYAGSSLLELGVPDETEEGSEDCKKTVNLWIDNCVFSSKGGGDGA